MFGAFKSRLAALIFLVGCCQYSFANEISSTDPGSLLRVADGIASNARINMIGARGAVQVSQVADQAQLELSLILIKQNQEIIRLLKVLTKEVK
jgi:hypothetical protein